MKLTKTEIKKILILFIVFLPLWYISAKLSLFLLSSFEGAFFRGLEVVLTLAFLGVGAYWIGRYLLKYIKK